MGLEVQGRVGDVDRVVVRGHLAGVWRGLVEDDVPARRSGLDLALVPHEQVRPAAVRDAVHLPVDRVEVPVLEARVDVLVVRDEVGVHRGDIAAGDEAQRGVTRRRDAVVAPRAHERDHLVRRVAGLDVDLAARLLLERGDPVDLRVGRPVLGVAGPGDDVQLALARAELVLHLDVRRLERGRAAAVASAVPARRDGEQRQHGEQRRPQLLRVHAPSSRCPAADGSASAIT